MVTALLFLSASLACGVLVPMASAAGPCPNEAIRQAQSSEALPNGTVSLPECMALEMVSPPKKYNQYAENPQFSANGDAVRFWSVAALAETPKLGSVRDIYVSSRGSSGWSTESTAVPPDLTVGYAYGTPCVFSPDLSRWATWASTPVQQTRGITTIFGLGLGGLFSTLSPTLNPLNLNVAEFAVTNGACEGGGVEASRMLLGMQGGSSGQPVPVYLPGDPLLDSPTAKGSNVYEAHLSDVGTPSVELLARDGNGTVYGGRCGVQVGGTPTFPAVTRRGSVSPDASRVYFTAHPTQPEGTDCDEAANKRRIMVRVRTPGGPEISQLISSECDRVVPPCSTANADDDFQGGSQEGTRVYFTTARQLADSDLDATIDLYLYDALRPLGERLTQVSAGDGTDVSPGEGAEVLGVPDFAGDGSHVYFVAKGLLTTAPNALSGIAEAGKPNLYLFERDGAYPAGRTVFIGTLDGADAGTWNSGPGKSAATAVPVLGGDFEDQSVGGDGHILVFQTKASLTADDTDGGRRDEYRYDSSSGSLQRVTHAAPGGTDSGPYDVKESHANSAVYVDGPQELYFGRWVSEDGETVVFSTEEALDPTDTAGDLHAYIWHDGEVTALPFAIQPTVSLSGEEVAFTTPSRLLAEDGDGARDVYLLRVNGGFPPPSPPPPPCEGEACQGPSQPPPPPIAAPSVLSGPGNSTYARCKKGFVRKKARCVKRHHHKQATNKRRGGK